MVILQESRSEIPATDIHSAGLSPDRAMLDIELVPRLDPIHLPKLCRQDNLALGRDGSLHAKYDIVLPVLLPTSLFSKHSHLSTR